jgi:hypothetical protein
MRLIEQQDDTKETLAAKPTELLTSQQQEPSVTDVSECLQRIAGGVSDLKRLNRLLSFVPAFLAPLLVVLIFLVRLSMGPDVFIHWITQPSPLLVLLLCLFAAPTMIATGIRKRCATLEATSNSLGEAGNTALVGPLIDLLGTDNSTVRRNAAAALTRLLPQLSAEDGDHLTAVQRERLIRRVSMNPDFFLYKDVDTFFRPPRLDRGANIEAIDFRVAILESFGRIGGAKELDIVRRLASSRSPHEAQKRLRAVAAEVLPSLEARVEDASRRDVLLRPAEAAAESATLLKPLESSSSSSDNLLYPSGR